MSSRIETIAILTHLRQGLDPDYFLARCKRFHWDREGRRVLVHQGTSTPPPAEVAILHVDLTVVPPDYLALARHYPRCVNAAVGDVSKRRISRSLVRADDTWDGAVVVKANLNHGGASERRLRVAEGGVFAKLREAALRWLPRAWHGRRGDDYQLFQAKAQVPAWVWQRRDLVVERYFAERHGEGYAIHQWFFLGGRGCVSTLVDKRPLVKWHPAIQRLPMHHYVPEALWQRRRQLGFDYGKFDFIMQEGEPVLLDANPTPHAGTTEVRERNLWLTGVLAAGIDFLAEDRGR
ncbi:MAG TPA: hypothetical protein VJL84_06880 [Kiloniellales bacterium]|nr:hypothetical protein [Kiloniellales bacterium]